MWRTLVLMGAVIASGCTAMAVQDGQKLSSEELLHAVLDGRLSLPYAIASSEETRESLAPFFRDLHPEWTEGDWEDIDAAHIRTGMTRPMVLLSWGTPNSRDEHVGRFGRTETWHYDHLHHWYLHFDDGVLQSWSKFDAF